MINTLFVEWISRQNQLLCRKYLVEETFDHLPGNEKDQLSPICSYGTWRLETPQYDDTQSQSIYKRTWKWGKTPERNSTTCEWISPTCCEKPERQCSTTIHCQRNLIFHVRQKKNYCIHYLTGQNAGLSGQKNVWPVIMTGDLLSVILSPSLTNKVTWPQLLTSGTNINRHARLRIDSLVVHQQKRYSSNLKCFFAFLQLLTGKWHMVFHKKLYSLLWNISTNKLVHKIMVIFKT